MMKYDVAVIGAGLGGLKCALLLAKAGRSVLVLEKECHVGGCLQSYRRRGLDYDTGFHYVGGLGEGQSLHDAFARLGLLDLPWHRLDEAYDHITIGDRTFSLVQGFEAFAGTLATEFPAEREALRRYAGLLTRVSRSGGEDVHPADGNSLLETGAWDYLEANFRDPLLRDVLSGNALRMELRRMPCGWNCGANPCRCSPLPTATRAMWRAVGACAVPARRLLTAWQRKSVPTGATSVATPRCANW